jgi:microsomal epoxide hydrolase
MFGHLVQTATLPGALPEGLPADLHAQIIALDKRFAVHLAAHVLEPSTLAYGLSDSPVGMLAWILERWVN